MSDLITYTLFVVPVLWAWADAIRAAMRPALATVPISSTTNSAQPHHRFEAP
jgi:hypothetical protein